MTDKNKEWMATGAIGCTFAAAFARKPEAVKWKTIEDARNMHGIGKNDGRLLLSLQFPGWDYKQVMAWALANHFYIEQIDKKNIGLRYKIGKNVSWVQYFGPDSHVITRQAPIPELMLCLKLPLKYFWRVGFTGILHLAHASVSGMTARQAETAWFTSFHKTKRLLGQSPDISQAAKTTFHI